MNNLLTLIVVMGTILVVMSVLWTLFITNKFDQEEQDDFYH